MKSHPIPARDVAKAKQLLAAAGAPNPRVTLMTTTVPEMMRAAHAVKLTTHPGGRSRIRTLAGSEKVNSFPEREPPQRRQNRAKPLTKRPGCDGNFKICALPP